MRCHRRIIYSTCGHSTFSPRPLIECHNAAIDPALQWSTTCEIVAHPYKSLRLDQLCPACRERRDTLLRDIRASQAVRFDEWQWKVSYGRQDDAADEYSWIRKVEKGREQTKEEDKEKTPKRTKSKRFSWRKSKSKSKRKSEKTPVSADGGEWPKTPKTA